MPDKLLPGNETVLLTPAIEVLGIPNFVTATGLVPFNLPTSALLNIWQGVFNNGSTGSGAGGNISCAVKDDMKLDLADSKTDGDRTLCSVGDSQILTSYAFDAEINIFRDEDQAANGVFNMTEDLVLAPDVPYLIVHRIGKPSTTPFAAGQEVDVYYVWTDVSIPGYSDGGNQTVNQKFIPKNVVRIAYVLPA